MGTLLMQVWECVCERLLALYLYLFPCLCVHGGQHRAGDHRVTHRRGDDASLSVPNFQPAAL